MKLSKQTIIEASLSLAALALLAALLIPWRQPNPAEEPSKTLAGNAEDLPGAALAPAHVSPDALYGLFASKASAPRETTPKTVAPAGVKKSADAPWLKYIGNIKGAEGKSYYFFKDTRSNRSISLSMGETVNGWTLLEIQEKTFVLKNNEDIYTVNKR